MARLDTIDKLRAIQELMECLGHDTSELTMSDAMEVLAAADICIEETIERLKE